METEERDNILKLDERLEHPSEEPCIASERRLRHNQLLLKENDSSTVQKLKEIIKGNFLGSELLLCSFFAALKSYRIDCCLRPFPQYFINKNNEKDFAFVKSACDTLPPLREFLSLPAKDISKEILNLLSWLFVDSGFPALKPYSLEALPLSVVNKKASINTLPHYVFEVKYTHKSEQTWKNRIGNRDIFYAYHGSSVDNFYSILKFGLQHNLNRGREVIFGKGIYLSNEISVCTNFAPFGETWTKSTLGNKHSIIALCEVINDEKEVKCKDEKNKKRAINHDSYDAIPEKYFVVTNSELVRIKYLLVYRFKATSIVKSFIKKHFLWITIILYFLMLVFIGFLNGPYWRKFVRNLSFLNY